MNMNSVGKFLQRELIDEIDATLIAGYGVNMLDAGVSREDAMEAYNECGNTIGAVEMLCLQRDIRRLQP